MEPNHIEGFEKIDSSCYMFVHLPSTHREAKMFCLEKGGHLAEIDSEREYHAVEDYWEKYQKDRICGDDEQIKSWWLGLTDGAQEGYWVSDTNGKQPNFTKWNGGGSNAGFKIHVGDFYCANTHIWEDQWTWFQDCILDTKSAEPNNLGKAEIIILAMIS